MILKNSFLSSSQFSYYKSQLVMGCIFIIQNIFILKWSFIAIIFVQWIMCLNIIFLHAPEHWVSSSRRCKRWNFNPFSWYCLGPCAAQSLLWMALCLGVLGGGKKCCVNANKCLRDARDTALFVFLLAGRTSFKVQKIYETGRFLCQDLLKGREEMF